MNSLDPFITWAEDLTELLKVELEELDSARDEAEREERAEALRQRARYAQAIAHLMSKALGSDRVPRPSSP